MQIGWVGLVLPAFMDIGCVVFELCGNSIFLRARNIFVDIHTHKHSYIYTHICTCVKCSFMYSCQKYMKTQDADADRRNISRARLRSNSSYVFIPSNGWSEVSSSKMTNQATVSTSQACQCNV